MEQAYQRGPRQGADEAVESLRRMVKIMNRYVHDIVSEFDEPAAATNSPPGPWGDAQNQARQALAGAAELLFRPEAGHLVWRPRRASGGPLAQRLDLATGLLTMGRDLLHTHFSTAADARRRRSEWSSLIMSRPVSQALLAEIGALARLAARQGAEAALAPQTTGAVGPGRC